MASSDHTACEEIVVPVLGHEPFAGSFRRLGCAVVRNTVVPAALAELIAFCDATYAARDETGDEAPDDGDEASRSAILARNRLSYDDIPQPMLTRAYGAIFSGGWLARFEALLGGPVGFLPRYTSIRRHGREASEYDTPFHQDASFILSPRYQQLGFPFPMIVLWIPLTPCGRDAPGIELALPTPARLLEYGIEGDRLNDKIEITEPVAGTDSPSGRQTWQPRFEVGDMLVMNQFTVHRTQGRTERMTRDRLALNLRLANAKAFREHFPSIPFVRLEAKVAGNAPA